MCFTDAISRWFPGLAKCLKTVLIINEFKSRPWLLILALMGSPIAPSFAQSTSQSILQPPPSSVQQVYVEDQQRRAEAAARRSIFRNPEATSVAATQQPAGQSPDGAVIPAVPGAIGSLQPFAITAGMSVLAIVAALAAVSTDTGKAVNSDGASSSSPTGTN